MRKNATHNIGALQKGVGWVGCHIETLMDFVIITV
jgi:hypothetical protein